MENKKGITLIALIVTIIVMLILAGIVLNLTIGENGIVRRAYTAKEINEEVTIKEKVGLMLSEYEIERYNEQRELKDYLNEQKSLEKINDLEDNEDGTYTIIIDDYIVIIDNDDLHIIGIEKNTEFKKITKGKAKFKYDDAQIEYVRVAQVGIEINEEVKGYYIQYKLDNDEASDWVNYGEGTTFEVKKNGYIYGRIVNPYTNEIGYQFKMSISNVDDKQPQNATFEFDKKTVNAGETIEATILQKDLETEINLTNCKYVVNKSATELGEDSSVWEDFSNFEENPQTIKISQKSVGDYYIHVLSEDMYGNKKETISEKLRFKGNETISNSNSFWTINRSISSTYLEANSSIRGIQYAYMTSKTPIDLTNVDSISLTAPHNKLSGAYANYTILGVVKSGSSNMFDYSNQVSRGGNFGAVTFTTTFDTTNLTGEYYIRYALRNTDGYSFYINGAGATITLQMFR